MPNRILTPSELDHLLQTHPYLHEEEAGFVDFSYLRAQLF